MYNIYNFDAQLENFSVLKLDFVWHDFVWHIMVWPIFLSFISIAVFLFPELSHYHVK